MFEHGVDKVLVFCHKKPIYDMHTGAEHGFETFAWVEKNLAEFMIAEDSVRRPSKAELKIYNDQQAELAKNSEEAKKAEQEAADKAKAEAEAAEKKRFDDAVAAGVAAALAKGKPTPPKEPA